MGSLSKCMCSEDKHAKGRVGACTGQKLVQTKRNGDLYMKKNAHCVTISRVVKCKEGKKVLHARHTMGGKS